MNHARCHYLSCDEEKVSPTSDKINKTITWREEYLNNSSSGEPRVLKKVCPGSVLCKKETPFLIC